MWASLVLFFQSFIVLCRYSPELKCHLNKQIEWMCINVSNGAMQKDETNESTKMAQAKKPVHFHLARLLLTIFHLPFEQRRNPVSVSPAKRCYDFEQFCWVLLEGITKRLRFAYMQHIICVMCVCVRRGLIFHVFSTIENVVLPLVFVMWINILPRWCCTCERHMPWHMKSDLVSSHCRI